MQNNIGVINAKDPRCPSMGYRIVGKKLENCKLYIYIIFYILFNYYCYVININININIIIIIIIIFNKKKKFIKLNLFKKKYVILIYFDFIYLITFNIYK